IGSLEMDKGRRAVVAAHLTFVTQRPRAVEAFEALRPAPDAPVATRGHFPRAEVFRLVARRTSQGVDGLVVPLLVKQPRAFVVGRFKGVRRDGGAGRLAHDGLCFSYLSGCGTPSGSASSSSRNVKAASTSWRASIASS